MSTNIREMKKQNILDAKHISNLTTLYLSLVKF